METYLITEEQIAGLLNPPTGYANDRHKARMEIVTAIRQQPVPQQPKAQQENTSEAGRRGR